VKVGHRKAEFFGGGRLIRGSSGLSQAGFGDHCPPRQIDRAAAKLKATAVPDRDFIFGNIGISRTIA
jgi:hypothetical protein